MTGRRAACISFNPSITKWPFHIFPEMWGTSELLHDPLISQKSRGFIATDRVPMTNLLLQPIWHWNFWADITTTILYMKVGLMVNVFVHRRWLMAHLLDVTLIQSTVAHVRQVIVMLVLIYWERWGVWEVSSPELPQCCKQCSGSALCWTN